MKILTTPLFGVMTTKQFDFLILRWFALLAFCKAVLHEERRKRKEEGRVYYKNLSLFVRVKVFFADGIFADTPVGNTNVLTNNTFLSV